MRLFCAKIFHYDIHEKLLKLLNIKEKTSHISSSKEIY